MKTITAVQKEMDSIKVDMMSNTKNISKSDRTKLKKKYEFLAICKMYLEHNPTEEYLMKEKERLSSRINAINKGYIPDERLIESGLKKEERKEHADYNKIMGLTKTKNQLQSIQFLLK